MPASVVWDTEVMNETTNAAIEVSGLRKQYGGRTILDGLNLKIPAGEVYALLGPNGAGKSTTIEILEGFRKADSGHVRVLGEVPATAPRMWRDRIGVVSQTTGDLGVYTPRELVTHIGSFYTNQMDPEDVLERVGLQDQATVRASKLSGGQKRRLDVALGIVGTPELLFLDEPTTGFDPEARRQFWDMLRGLADSGTTIILTTHYLDEAAELAHRVGVLHGGVLVAEDEPMKLGGADARVPIVRWRGENGDLRSERTREPGALVSRLSAAGEPADLEVLRPSLEDIYLELIGHTSATAHAEILETAS